MFHGVFTLVGRSLRLDERSLLVHLARLGLLTAIYASLCLSLINRGWFGAPGLQFFYGGAYLNLLFVSLTGISFFSTPITEEREEDTLGLMLMAGISPLGILLGKSGGRLLQALLLITLQYPFTLLAITMGGVTHRQVGAVYLGLTAYVVLLAGFGLFCSTISVNNRTAATRMIYGVSAYVLIPMISSAVRWWFKGAVSWLDPVVEFSVVQQIGVIMTTGFGDSIVSWQVSGNLALGGVFFGLAWLLFGRCSQLVATDIESRGLVALNEGWKRWLSPGRCWGNSFLWKDFYFSAGGPAMIPIRLTFCIGLYLLAVVRAAAMGAVGIDDLEVTMFQVFLSLALVVDAGRVMSRSLHDEIRGQTLASICMLPESSWATIYWKFAGALLGCLPLLLVDAIVTVGTETGRHNFYSILDEPAGMFVLFCFLLIPNLAAFLAVYLRWGAVSLSAAIAVTVFYTTLVTVRNPTNNWLYLYATIVLAASLACHLGIARRLRVLAVQG